MAISIKERIAKAKAEADAAEARVARPEFVENEEALRELEAQKDRARKAVERERQSAESERNALIDERVEFWRSRVDGNITTVIIPEKPHWFIVKGAGNDAWKRWKRAIEDNARAEARRAKPPHDRDKIARAYIVDGLLDWNGQAVGADDVDTELGVKLHKFLDSEALIAEQLHDAILRLDGAGAEERKS